MPNHVRNFWFTGRVDGRDTKLESGPRAKDGGFELVIKQREDGGIADGVVRVSGQVSPDGSSLVTVVTDPEGNEVYRRVTAR